MTRSAGPGLSLVGVLRHAAAGLIALVSLGLQACHGGASGNKSDAGKPDAGATDSAVPPGRRLLTVEQARDPKECMNCHPNHYSEWQASMHAYAARDPVFLAMNARGQRETNGELGDFCVKCHAPMAVLTGMTKDGLNLPDLPDDVKGVTCYFCHNATAVDGMHNATMKLGNDVTMHGPIRDPHLPGVHKADYSPMFDGSKAEGSAFCGGCHDIVTLAGVHLERTFEEYQSGIFSKQSSPGFLTCNGCHMKGAPGLAADDPPSGVGLRTVHEHLWPGVDVQLDDSPGRDVLTSAVADCQLGSSASYFSVDTDPFGKFTFTMETNAGHREPSGAAQDRRLWLEVVAYDDADKVVFSSGQIADDEIEEKPADDPKYDKNLFMMRDRIYDADGMPTHMFWKAATSDAHPNGYEQSTLRVAMNLMPGSHTSQKSYQSLLIAGSSGTTKMPARVTARLRMRPMGLDVLQDLVDSGDLDPAVMAQMPTFSLGDATVEWKRSDFPNTVWGGANNPDCYHYRCLLYPGSDACNAK